MDTNDGCSPSSIFWVKAHTIASLEESMRKNNIRIAALALVVLVFLSCRICSRAQVEKTPYPAMAPLDQYLISDENAEIALARSAAPASVSNAAEVMVLRRDGYATAVKGSNGFLCIVERAWANPSDASDFWNPKMRAPTCYNSDGSCKHFSAYLSHEDQAGDGRKIEGGDQRGDIRIGAEKQGTAGPCAWSDVLH